MPKNKNAADRYKIIDRCLVNKKIVSIEDIIEACRERDIPVSESQIRKDFKAMREDNDLEYYAPIKNVRPRRYMYTESDYSINKLQLTDYEIEALGFTSKIFDQLADIAPFDQIQGAVDKIINHVKARKQLNEKEFHQFIDFEKVPHIGGVEHLELLIRAIKDKKAVKIKYKAFGSKRTFTHILHPYLIKEYRNRFYVFGYNDYWKGLRIYGLDRIEKVDITYSTTYKKSKIPPTEYFKNVIGVTKFAGTKPELIKLKVSKQQTPYLITQPLHESQELIEKNPEYSIFTIKVHESPELEIKLLGWHSEVEVLEPESLRKRIKEMIEEVAKVYGIV